jgi:serine/threonine protein kinase
LDLTQTGMVMGTSRSMAPEQHLGAEADERTDLYAVGLLLYELVCGRGPFDHVGRGHIALRTAHCSTPAAPPSALAPQPIPRAVDDVVLRALAKRQRDRFASARVMAEALRAASDHGSNEGPTYVDPSFSMVTVREGAAVAQLEGGVAN